MTSLGSCCSTARRYDNLWPVRWRLVADVPEWRVRRRRCSKPLSWLPVWRTTWPIRRSMSWHWRQTSQSIVNLVTTTANNINHILSLHSCAKKFTQLNTFRSVWDHALDSDVCWSCSFAVYGWPTSRNRLPTALRMPTQDPTVPPLN